MNVTLCNTCMRAHMNWIDWTLCPACTTIRLPFITSRQGSKQQNCCLLCVSMFAGRIKTAGALSTIIFCVSMSHSVLEKWQILVQMCGNRSNYSFGISNFNAFLCVSNNVIQVNKWATFDHFETIVPAHFRSCEVYNIRTWCKSHSQLYFIILHLHISKVIVMSNHSIKLIFTRCLTYCISKLDACSCVTQRKSTFKSPFIRLQLPEVYTVIIM